MKAHSMKRTTNKISIGQIKYWLGLEGAQLPTPGNPTAILAAEGVRSYLIADEVEGSYLLVTERTETGGN